MRFPGHLRRARGDDIAVDLGTANTVVFVRGHGIALFEPSVVAVDETTGEVLAVGEEARRMIGRTPAAIRATRPLRHGVITDFEVTEGMLRHFIRRTIGTGRRHPRVILCVRSGITEVERRAVEEATLVAGAREARLIEEPMAAAIGADLPIAEPRASMIVDIGGGMVVWESIRVGGYEMDEAIVDHVKKQYGLLIGQERAEEAKIAIGCAVDTDELQESEVAGRDMISGLLRRLLVGSDELRHALEGPIARIVDAVKDTLERTPPELSADVMERGIVLAGGGALPHGMSERLRVETGLPVHVVDSPLTCVAVGAGRSLEEFEAISRSSAGRPLRRGL